MSAQGILCEMVSAALTTSGANTVNFDPIPEPIELVRWGFIASTSVTSVAAAISLNRRITAGNDTGRELAAGGTINLVAANDPDTVAGGGIWATPPSRLLVLPGEQLQVQVTAATAAGVVRCFIQYYRLPFQKLAPHLNLGTSFHVAGGPNTVVAGAQTDLLANMVQV